MLLLTDLTNAPDNKGIGVEVNKWNKWKNIADTHINTTYEKYHR